MHRKVGKNSELSNQVESCLNMPALGPAELEEGQDSTCCNEDLRAVSINKVLKCFWGFFLSIFPLFF